MIDDSAAGDGDPGDPEPGPTRRYEPIVGTLVVVTRDRELLVEFDGPEGECRRRTALAITPIESNAVGHPVELMFVEGDLDRPVLTKLVDWKVELWARWAALGRKALGYEPGPWKVEALAEECKVLVCVAAWFREHGNKTHAANLVGTSRKVLRDRTAEWKSANPRLVPVPLVKELEAKARRSRAKARKPNAEGHAPASAGSCEHGGARTDGPASVRDGGIERDDGSVADG